MTSNGRISISIAWRRLYSAIHGFVQDETVSWSSPVGSSSTLSMVPVGADKSRRVAQAFLPAFYRRLGALCSCTEAVPRPYRQRVKMAFRMIYGDSANHLAQVAGNAEKRTHNPLVAGSSPARAHSSSLVGASQRAYACNREPRFTGVLPAGERA